MKRPSHPARSSTVPLPTSRPSPRRRSASAQTTTAEGSSHKGRSLVRGEQLRRYGACTACRRRRTKCDAVKPHCGACVRHHNYLKRTQASTYDAKDCGCTYDRREGSRSTDASVSEEDEDGLEVSEETVSGREKEGKRSRAKGKSKEKKSRSASRTEQEERVDEASEEMVEEHTTEKEDDIGRWALDNAIWEETPQSRSSFSSSDTSLWLTARPSIPLPTAQNQLIPADFTSTAFAIQPWTAQSTLPLPNMDDLPAQPPNLPNLIAQYRHDHQTLFPAVPDFPFRADTLSSAGQSAVPLNGPNPSHRGYEPWHQLPAFLPRADPTVPHPAVIEGPYQPQIPAAFGSHQAAPQLEPSPIHSSHSQAVIALTTGHPNQSGPGPGRPLSLTGSVDLPPQSNLFYQLHQLFSVNNTIDPSAPPISARRSSHSEQSQPIRAEEMIRSQTYPQAASSRPAQAHPFVPVLQAPMTSDSAQDVGIAALLRRDNLSIHEYEELLRHMWRG